MERQVAPTKRPRNSRGSSRVDFQKLIPPRSYPRSSNDSKMSVSMRSHSMLLWYSNFRVVRLPSHRQRVHSRMRSLPGTSKSTAGASVSALRMLRACASSLVPPTAPPHPLKMAGCARAHYGIVKLAALRRAGTRAAWQRGSETQPGGAELLECACAQLGARQALEELEPGQAWVFRVTAVMLKLRVLLTSASHHRRANLCIPNHSLGQG